MTQTRMDRRNDGIVVPPSPVRLLANRYAAGELEHRAYILERRRLIDAIVAGEMPLPEVPRAPPALLPLISNAGGVLSDADATIELPRAKSTLRSWWWVAGLSGALGGIGSWLWLALRH